MAIRVTLECGHASMLRVRTTPEGYTHDWEVFVRGVDNADIHQYIEKVVFLLHDTFRNPKRVLKEPPFVVKESGYAGFIIPIEIHLRNKDEPKKFQITYDLHLQPSGPPINNVIRHVEVISNPSDEFRRKLLKGGAVMVSTRDGSLEKNDAKTSALVGKPKLGGSEIKRHRIIESKTPNSFHDLFGPPIKTTKISPDNKKVNQPDKNLVAKPLTMIKKPDKVDKSPKVKESLHKDVKKDKIDEKKDRRIEDSSKDKFKSKEKSKKPPSPASKSHSSPVSKRPASPVAMKKPLSPLPQSVKRSLSPRSKEREAKKIMSEKDKESKEKDKAKYNSRNSTDSSKSDKKKDKKKYKEDKDKERRDKYKEAEKANVKDVAKLIEKKPEKTDKADRLDKEKPQEYKSSRDGRKSPKTVKENDKARDDKPTKTEKPEKSEKAEKLRDNKSEKDRQKHKHKKRDKRDKRDSNKERERKDKHEGNKDAAEKQNNVSSVPVANPLSTLLAEIPERDSSDSAPSMDDDSLPDNKPIHILKKEAEHPLVPAPADTKPLSPGMEIKKEKSDRNKKERTRSSRSDDRESRKRKRRSESKGDDESVVKHEKNRDQSTSPPLEPVSSSQSPVVADPEAVQQSEMEKKEMKKDKDNRDAAAEQAMKDERGGETDVEQVAPDSTNNSLIETEMNESPVFSEDYLSQLKDLQHKIMTLQDNQELQRVVQVIAETGQYEITKKTFDFDLCALDRRTVQRLQQFFSAS